MVHFFPKDYYVNFQSGLPNDYVGMSKITNIMKTFTKSIACKRSFRGLLLLLFFVFADTSANAQLIYGIGDNKLISFDAGNPAAILSSVKIKGISGGQKIEGADFRPLTGELYLFGYKRSSKQYQLYTVNLSTGQATAVNSPATLDLGPSNSSSKLQIGFDFNPTVDRIRVTSTLDFNYRLNPINGAVAATDLMLNYAAGDVNHGENPLIDAVAYTNSYAGATSTTLYDLDTDLSILATQNPPNNGVLNTVGGTGISFGNEKTDHDIDIFFNTTTLTNKAFILANKGKKPKLYSVNFSSGAATLIGDIGHNKKITDIAVFIDRNLPAVTGNLVYALTSNNHLISFDSNAPRIVRSQLAVTGVIAGQTLVGMDFRPATGELFALGYNGTNGESQMYIINPATGAAAVVNSTPTVLALGMSGIAMDFNPTVDRIRVVAINDVNYRLNPANGAIAATDLNLSYAPADVNSATNPNVNAVAYTNSFSGSVTTTLYDYDVALNILATQLPPNNGTLNTVGSSGITVNGAEPSVDLDIFSDMVAATNVAYLAANTGSSTNDNFYTINLSTGMVSLVNGIGYGIAVRNIAVKQGGAPPRLAAGTTIDKLFTENSVKVYPNPTSGSLTIELQGGEKSDALIEVYDLRGKNMGISMQEFFNSSTTKQIDLSQLPQGIYLLNVRMDGNISQQKIVVQ